MTEGRLQRYIAFSFAIHLAFITAITLSVNRSRMLEIHSPYIKIDLYAAKSPGRKRHSAKKRAVKRAVAPKKKATKKAIKPAPRAAKPKPAPAVKKAPDMDRAYVSDRLAALKSKKRARKIVETRQRLRDRKISALKRPEPAAAPAAPAAPAAAAPPTTAEPPTTAAPALGDMSNPVIADYYSIIEPMIWQHWAYPSTGKEDLEAIVYIHIAPDGTITEKKLEKSSGNKRFDNSALRALKKASPLEPPPYEMDLGLRFKP